MVTTRPRASPRTARRAPPQSYGDSSSSQSSYGSQGSTPAYGDSSSSSQSQYGSQGSTGSYGDSSSSNQAYGQQSTGSYGDSSSSFGQTQYGQTADYGQQSQGYGQTQPYGQQGGNFSQGTADAYGAAPGGYGQTQQYGGYGQPQQQASKTMSYVALGLGIGAFIFMWITWVLGLPLGIAAVVCGAIGMKKEPTGKVFSIIGLVLGVISIIGSIFTAIVLITAAMSMTR